MEVYQLSQPLLYSKVSEVKTESEALLRAGQNGNYIFDPAHAVESYVPLQNMLMFINTAKNQESFKNN